MQQQIKNRLAVFLASTHHQASFPLRLFILSEKNPLYLK